MGDGKVPGRVTEAYEVKRWEGATTDDGRVPGRVTGGSRGRRGG